MEQLTLVWGQPERAAAIMRETAAWARAQGFRVWPEACLTPDALLTPEAPPEAFCVGRIGEEDACALILQTSDREFWPDAPDGEAVYLHKFCVRPTFAHQGMTGRVLKALRALCKARGVRYIRLDAGAGEQKVGDVYRNAGFSVVRTVGLGRQATALYELDLEREIFAG